jgi:signal transduction histidine kinase
MNDGTILRTAINVRFLPSEEGGIDESAAEPAPGPHHVQFFESEAFLSDTVAAFIGAGLAAAGPVVAITTEPRWRRVCERLAARSFDLDRARRDGGLTWLDAHVVLAKIMVDGMPDPRLFEEHVGHVIAREGEPSNRGPLRAYGEMVDCLWKQGNARAAVRLEELWNELIGRHSFTLLCAYAMGNFYKESDGEGFREVCALHSHVVPAESYTEIDGLARLREVSVLQQRATALETEVEQRKALERTLRTTLEEREGAEESLRNALSELQRASTERADLLAREKAARQDAEAVNRLKDDFLATLSHELRTPLNAILGWANALRNGSLPAEKHGRALDTIERNARLQAKLIEDVLDVSRIIAGKMSLRLRNIDLAGVIGAAVDGVRPLALTKDIGLSVELDPHAGVVAGDADRLEQVVWNLLSNAIKFTPQKGRVSVRLDRIDCLARIRVTDTGRGIGADFLPHVFDRFRQADTSCSRLQGGLGLGLSIVEQLVTLHGGTVSAQSGGEGKGAEFTVCLPTVAVCLTDISEAPSPGSRPSPRLGGIRVQLVEDDADARALMEIVMRDHGAEVRAVGTASEGLALLQDWGPHVLISDIGLPGEDGYELMHKVRGLPIERGGSVPAIALTAFASAEDKWRAMTAGYQIHVPKPVETEELVRVVAELARWGGGAPAWHGGSATRVPEGA